MKLSNNSGPEVYIYVMRKVRIGTILGLTSCAKLGSELCGLSGARPRTTNVLYIYTSICSLLLPHALGCARVRSLTILLACVGSLQTSAIVRPSESGRKKPSYPERKSEARYILARSQGEQVKSFFSRRSSERC